MRLLLDNNLSERLIALLRPGGWDVAHVRPLGLADAADPVVLELARTENRILVSADTDFGGLLAVSRATDPSMVLIRRVAGRRAEEIAGILLANLPLVTAELEAGAVVAIEEEAMRVRRLPIV